MSFLSGTPQDLEECLAAEYASLFANETFCNSNGTRMSLRTHVHSEPIRQGSDDADDAELPEPYIIAAVTGGRIADENSAQQVTAASVICICDDGTARQGHKDALHIIHRIYERFAKNPVLAGKYSLVYPIEWTLAEDDTYPYYFGGILLNFEAPAIGKEDPLA